MSAKSVVVGLKFQMSCELSKADFHEVGTHIGYMFPDNLEPSEMSEIHLFPRILDCSLLNIVYK